MFTRLAPALVLALALPAAAAELSDRYEAIGTMTVTLGDDTLDFVIPYDREKDSAYAEQKLIMGAFLTLNSVGQTVGDDGKPGRPMVQVTLQKQGDALKLLSAEMFDHQGYDAPMVMGADGGTGDLVEVSFENDRLEARVEGSFLRLTGYMSEPRPADGADPVPATISWSVDIPPMD